MATTALIPHFIAYLFMGLSAHLFQPTAHFKLFLNVNLNFYLQTLADPLNLLLRPKMQFWDLSQHWTDCGLLPQ